MDGQLLADKFKDDIGAAQQAARLDPSNKELNTENKIAREIASTRLSGNMPCKAAKFSKAYIVYK